MVAPYFVLLADNHPLFRREIRKIIEDVAGLKVVGEVATGEELYHFLKESQPHLLILDVSLPNFRAMEATQKIKKNYPGVDVLILIWDRDPEYLFQALAAGATGCLLKQDVGTELLPAIKTICQGGVYLPVSLSEIFLRQYSL